MQSQPGGSQRGLDARVARADDGYITASSTVRCHICHLSHHACTISVQERLISRLKSLFHFR